MRRYSGHGYSRRPSCNPIVSVVEATDEMSKIPDLRYRIAEPTRRSVAADSIGSRGAGSHARCKWNLPRFLQPGAVFVFILYCFLTNYYHYTDCNRQFLLLVVSSLPLHFMAKPKRETTRRRSLSDPLAAALLPPPNESPIQREQRLKAENEARKVSAGIDEMIRQERNDRKKSRAEVNVLLLGQSESGKSTTLKREYCSFALEPNVWNRYWLCVPISGQEVLGDAAPLGGTVDGHRRFLLTPWPPNPVFSFSMEMSERTWEELGVGFQIYRGSCNLNSCWITTQSLLLVFQTTDVVPQQNFSCYTRQLRSMPNGLHGEP